MADETPLQVLHEPERRAQTKSYMWLFRSGEDGGPPIILYKYSETRAGDNAIDFLHGFKGYLILSAKFAGSSTRVTPLLPAESVGLTIIGQLKISLSLIASNP